MTPIGTPQPSRVTVKLKQQLICRPPPPAPGLTDDDGRRLSRRAGGVSVHVVRTALRDWSKPTVGEDGGDESPEGVSFSADPGAEAQGRTRAVLLTGPAREEPRQSALAVEGRTKKGKRGESDAPPKS